MLTTTVLCNYGPREEVLIDELTERDVGYVIVKADLDAATYLHEAGYTAMFGDPESDAALRRARLEHATALIANVDDETNPSVLLSAREVNPGVRTVSLSMTLAEERRRKGDVVIAGMGVVGRAVATAIASAGLEYTTIDCVEAATVDVKENTTVDVIGNATDRDVLREAGTADARTVVLALPDDTAAIFATFVIRELNPGIEIIARANDHEGVSKLYRAGADNVLSLAAVSGRMLALIVLDEEILSAGTQLKLVRTKVPDVVGESLGGADIRNRTGCTVVAAERNGDIYTNPGPTFVIESGDELVVAGTDENISRFQAMFV